MLKEINVRQFSKFSSRKSPFVNTVVGPLSKVRDNSDFPKILKGSRKNYLSEMRYLILIKGLYDKS